MKKFFDSLDRFGRFAENTLLVVLLGTMIGVAVLQIINRQLLDGSFSLSWADQLIKIIVLWLAMIGSVAAARDNKHIRIDLVTQFLSGTAITWIKLLVDLFAAGVCGVVGWHAYRLIREQMTWGDTVFSDIPLWLLNAILPLAFVLLSYQFLVRSAKLIIELVAPSEEAAGT